MIMNLIRNKITFSFIFILGLFTSNILCQQYTSREFHSSLLVEQKIDTTLLMSDRPVKSPWGAVARSAILPGLGQIYNHQYIKAGVAFSLNAFLAYHIYYYEMKWRDKKNPDFQGKRNLYSWYFALGYLLTMVDAYVDAYLYDFNEAIQIAQNIERKNDQWLFELRFSYRF
jgi:hypothetical protein